MGGYRSKKVAGIMGLKVKVKCGWNPGRELMDRRNEKEKVSRGGGGGGKLKEMMINLENAGTHR